MIRKKILSQTQAIKKIRSLAKKKRVVFTNGCFDILHPGHVLYLESAKKLGDVLVVALNTDASVRRLKGPTRPINSLEDRATVMAALGSVDWVTSFSQDTPLELIEKALPNILVKGGDWKPNQIVGADAVMGAGGKVISLNFVKGKSTTKTLERAQKKAKLGTRSPKK